MKKLYTLGLFFFLLVQLSFAQFVQIGTTTATQSYLYGPYYRSSTASVFNYSKYAYIYSATELAGIPPGSARQARVSCAASRLAAFATLAG